MISVPNKRRHEDLEDRGHFHQAKRLCNGFGSCGQVEYGAVVDSPMDTRENQQQGLQNCNSLRNHHAQNMVYTAQAGVYPQMCPRCMAGEPGHINHIMGCWTVQPLIFEKTWCTGGKNNILLTLVQVFCALRTYIIVKTIYFFNLSTCSKGMFLKFILRHSYIGQGFLI